MLLIFLLDYPKETCSHLPGWMCTGERGLIRLLGDYWLWTHTHSWRLKTSLWTSSQSRAHWRFSSSLSQNRSGKSLNPSCDYFLILGCLVGRNTFKFSATTGRTSRLVLWPMKWGLYIRKDKIEALELPLPTKIIKAILHSWTDCRDYYNHQWLERYKCWDSYHIPIHLSYLTCAKNRWILKNDSVLSSA